jgi:tetratricopeptide (TPR) repeat protein
MNYITGIFLFFTFGLKAQDTLKFDKRFVECEDKWVAFQKDEDGSHPFGFIYIDAQAGLTLDYAGSFRIGENGRYIVKRLDSTSMKYRLQPNRVRVAVIPESRYGEMGVTDPPDWLQYYKTDTGTAKRLTRWGFLYNSWGNSKKALEFLERAQKIDSKYKGLEFELAYAYNATEQYDKAIGVLQGALKTSPDDCYLYKELSYSEMHLGMLDKASVTCKTGITKCTDKQMKSEMAYNLAYQYHKAKDKANFAKWVSESKQWATPGDQYMKALEGLESTFKE